ncbi:MAG: galactokinase [Planctomycetota bacterium]
MTYGFDLTEAAARFLDVFGGVPQRSFFAPGRVELIGSHVDYNGGHVLAAAIDRGTYLLLRQRKEEVIRFASMSFDCSVIEFGTNELIYRESDGWASYPKGVLHFLRRRGYRFGGLDMLFGGDLPLASGLSSSASIEMATAVAISTLAHVPVRTMDLVRTAQRAENEFIGLKCGIMDQLASGFGRSGRALMIDCKKVRQRTLPFDDASMKILLLNTKVQRGLQSSAYNDRVETCNAAFKKLKAKLPDATCLCDVTPEQLEKHGEALTEIERKRARHVIGEEQRVRQAAAALDIGDASWFGELLDASHESARDLYEVSCEELDVMVELARSREGCYGARLTGAGFGGCALAVVQPEAVARVALEVCAEYRERTGIAAEAYLCATGDGARPITLPDLTSLEATKRGESA